MFLFPATILLLSLLAPLAVEIRADEPMRDFVRALSDQDEFELAIEYLDSLAEQSTLSAANRQQLPLEKAQTLSSFAARSTDLRKANALLQRAQQAIEAFRPSDDSPNALSELTQFRGNLLFNQARVATVQAQNTRISTAERQQLNQRTRTLLESSSEQYRAAAGHLRQALKTTRVDPEDDSTILQVKRLRNRFTFLKTRGPTVSELIADTYPEGSSERTERLEKAAIEAAEVWQKYFKYGPAAAACLTAARCRQKLGQHESCLVLVNELLSVLTGPSVTPTKREAMSIASRSWEQEKPFPWEKVIDKTQRLVQSLSPAATNHPQWQPVKLTLARALRINAEEVGKQKGGAAKRRAAELSESAIAMATEVANITSDSQRSANELLQSWNVNAPQAAASADSATPRDFDSAAARVDSLVAEVQNLYRNAVASKDPSTQRRLADRATATLNAIDQAIELSRKTTDADPESSSSSRRDSVIRMRYLQCFCHLALDQHWEAAVIGEFLLDKYPNVEGSRQAAAIALRSYDQLEAQPSNAALAGPRLIRTSELLLNRFPGTTEAASAAAKLATRAMKEQDWDAAKSYQQIIPEGSPARRSVAVSLGRQAWSNWLQNAETRDPRQLVNAQGYFREAVDNASEDKITYAMADAALLLADVHLASGDLSAAVDRLESASVAPLRLITEPHRAIVNSNRLASYQQRVAMTAVKIYMTALQQSPDDPQWINKTHDIITDLQASAKQNGAGTDAAQKRLTGVYRAISQRLLNQFQNLPAGEPRIEFGVTLSQLLSSLEQDATDSPTVVWAGATLLSVANTLKESGAAEQAKPVFDQAVKALDRAESLGLGSGEQGSSLTRELNRQRALAQLGGGNFDAAIEQFATLLAEQPSNLAMQMDAAFALQLKGRSTNQPADFAAAITGTSPVVDPKTKRRRNAIWGWRKLVKATRGNKKLANAFYECLYRMIECRYELAVADNSTDGVQTALAELNNWQKRIPNLGGTAWKPKFDDLKKRIETR